jgi:hypothetical protein
MAIIGLVSVAGILFAKGRIELDSEAADLDHDHEILRQQWFREGRTVNGKIAADLLHRAYRQKLALQRHAESALSLANGNPVLPSWQNLGPVGLTSDPSGFQSYGPVTGRATTVAVDQNDASGNTVYVGGALGGLWKSTNATANPAVVSWTPLIDSQPTLAVGALALKPDTTGATTVILAGTGEPDNSGDSYYGLGVLRSADAGATWQLISSDTLGHVFKGMGFSRIAFNTTDTDHVVAAASNAGNGIRLGANFVTPAIASLYYSSNAGLTWTLAFVSDDGSNAITPTSATDVVFDRFNGKFYALVRRHGMYSSSDGGKTWQRLSAQPGPGLSTSACPANAGSNCPLVRGHIAVQPNTGDLYVTYMSFDGGGSEALQGIFRSTDGGNSWSGDLGQNGYTNCGDSAGCGALQSAYDLYLHAVPSSAGTDLYLGGINIYRCHLPNGSTTTCNWVNLTHVYGCGNPIAAASHVHPDQHEMTWLAANPRIMYFANDGGVYSSLNGAAVDGACNPANSNSWQNLNANLGSMTEFVWLSQDVADPGTLLGGTQDNGSPALSSGSWAAVNTGDGGYNEINPADSSVWYTSNFYLSIQRCASGTNCSAAQFVKTISNQSAEDDNSAFYPPFMLDPLDPQKMIVGTCRVWRGPADGSAWPGAADANALSFNFNAGNSQFCAPDSSSMSFLSALAAGGRPAPSGASSVIYAGRADGHIFVSTAAESGPGSFNDRSFNPLAGTYKISAIAVDRNDPSGFTAVATRMGFGVGHVWRTTNAGANWADISGNLPDAPADSALVDPADSQHIFVGMDVGVFETHDGGANWVEAGTGLPNVPATRLLLFDGPGTRKLRVSTYGRGIWELSLAPAPFFALQLASGASANASVNTGQSATYNLSLVSNNGFSGSVNLSCSGAPAGATCSISPSSTNLAAANTVPIQVTIATQAHAGLHGRPFSTWPFVFAVCFSGLMFTGKKPRVTALVLLGVLMIGGIISCGGGGASVSPSNSPGIAAPVTPSGSTIIVTATSGGQTRSVALKLTIH